MFGFLGDIGSAIMTPLYYAVSAVLVAWHWVFSQVPGLSSGWTWAFSIVGLTVTIRTLLIPLFVKQIKSSRNMQLLQPKIKELQKKYGHDRERLTQEQMKLWKDTGTNPFASCMPLILQMPVFFALFRTIDQAANKGGDGAKGFLSFAQAESLQNATLLGARIADTFLKSDNVETKILTMALVVVMCITQFLTQRQLMAKNMPADAMSGPYAQQQKMLLYVLPVVFAVGGVAFPLGVLIYWTTSNAWTMGQQFYVIRNNPAPGTPAFKAKQERDTKHGKTAAEDPLKEIEEEAPKPPPRQQPKNQPRSQRKKPPSTSPQGKKRPPVKRSPSDPIDPNDPKKGGNT
ncbi:MAG: membrane protein insertase YidC [Kineosporiaceae bacterium]|nr:membrane protein insertase YidC [Aeromicrobium sp.]